MNRKEPWEGYYLLPAFLCAHIFIERETSGYEAEDEEYHFLCTEVLPHGQRWWMILARKNIACVASE